MTIQYLDMTDMIGIGPEGNLSISICDYLNWQDMDAHGKALIHKILNYIQYIEENHLREINPGIPLKPIDIRVFCQYRPPVIAEKFFAFLATYFEQSNVRLTYGAPPGRAYLDLSS